MNTIYLQCKKCGERYPERPTVWGEIDHVCKRRRQVWGKRRRKKHSRIMKAVWRERKGNR